MRIASVDSISQNVIICERVGIIKEYEPREMFPHHWPEVSTIKISLV